MNDVFATAPAEDRPRAVALTAAAARRVAVLIEADGKPDLMLRLTVSGGGCSGFQYGFGFDDTAKGDDAVFERDGVRLVVDQTSLDLLAGSEIDFVEDLVGSSFQVRNPNASSSCGCGSSFSI
ncbi:MAG: iron-sulfur cluster insertion protein ErpA [Alphaproteobacteria bacterium]